MFSMLLVINDRTNVYQMAKICIKYMCKLYIDCMKKTSIESYCISLCRTYGKNLFKVVQKLPSARHEYEN